MAMSTSTRATPQSAAIPTSSRSSDDTLVSDAAKPFSPFPDPTFTQFRKTAGRPRIPQTIAHRGYKAKYPENTLTAFRAAVEEGRAHALETDIHLTKDDVVVLSHDPTLKRCFGRPEKIVDTLWEEIAPLRTVKEPRSPMPRLADLLEYVSDPSLSHIWILLDIKLDNDADKVMRLIAKTLASTGNSSQWPSRIVLGIWAELYLPLCTRYLPGYPVSYIGFSPYYARKFLQVPNISFNMLQRSLIGLEGHYFIRQVREHHRKLYLWTVNDPKMMRWSIKRQADGVITDDPKLFNQVCDEWTDDGSDLPPLTWRELLMTIWLFPLLAAFAIPWRHRVRGNAKTFMRQERERTMLKTK